MSKSGVKSFFGDLSNDSALKAEAEGVGNPGALADFAKSKGYDVTVDDLNQLANKGGDMSEEELDKVAAGGVGVSVGCIVCLSFS